MNFPDISLSLLAIKRMIGNPFNFKATDLPDDLQEELLNCKMSVTLRTHLNMVLIWKNSVAKRLYHT